MERKIKSMRGDIVDFDLLDIKQQMGKKPVSIEVENREKFISSKRRRGGKKTINKLLKMDTPPISTEVEATPVVTNPPERKNKRIIKKTK